MKRITSILYFKLIGRPMALVGGQILADARRPALPCLATGIPQLFRQAAGAVICDPWTIAARDGRRFSEGAAQ